MITNFCPEKEKEERIIIHKKKLCPELIVNKFRPMRDRIDIEGNCSEEKQVEVV